MRTWFSTRLSVVLTGGAVIVCNCDQLQSHHVDADTLPILTLSEELRLGSVDDPNAGFSNIGAVRVNSDANIYVLDRQERQIRIYDPAGTRLNTLGGSGQGPGEFTRPENMGFQGDTLWVTDSGSQRVTMFESGGSLLTSFRLVRFVSLPSPSNLIKPFARGGVVRTDGYVHMEELGAVVVLEGGSTPPDSLAVPVLRYDRNGTPVDTANFRWLYLVESKNEGSPGRLAQTDMMLDPGPPADTPLRLYLDDEVLLVDRRAAESPGQARFTVARIAPDHDTAYHRDFVYDAKPFSDAFVDSLTSVRGSIEMPAFQPPISAAHHGEDGTLWLRRETDSPGPHTWLVVSSDGTPIGQIQLPRDARIQWLSEEAAYVVEPDQMGVPWVVRYAIGK